jgi:hypothetical protein
MLAYRLPFFLDYLSHHYFGLYKKYTGRLIELFPSSRRNDENLVIVHDAADTPDDDELVMKLWKEFEGKE